MVTAMREPGWRKPSVLPGFGLGMGITIFWMGLIILLPLAFLVWHSSNQSLDDFVQAALLDRRVLHAYWISLSSSVVAAVINTVLGTIVAWTLVRYRFPGHRLLDAMVDLPFALPTAVSGIALTSLLAGNGALGQWLEQAGIRVAFTQLGIIAALTLITMPFVVRSVQPAVENLQHELEEVAASMGASRITILRQIVLPTLLPSILTGMTLAFARALGEYGSVIFIAGNLPFRTEIAPLLIVIKLEQFDYMGATAIATTIMIVSLLLLLLINSMLAWQRRRGQGN
ncbi:MAG: sulfate ABC transporter permease subunit CysT [Gammaproteobacteria bacterium]|nr:sulfate ABC transporter permease subunit CysT [Gammaproteobacteria bacterium]